MKVFLCVLFFLISGLVTQAEAQWVPTSGPYDTGGIQSLLADGDFVVAATATVGLYVSSNRGASWGLIYPGPWSREILCLASSGVYLYAGTKNDGIHQSTDKGQTWAKVNISLGTYGVRAFAMSGSNVFAGTDGGAYITTNNGTSWNTISNGLPSGFAVGAIAARGTDIYVGANAGGLFHSPDNGVTWKEIDSGMSVKYIQALAVTNDYVYAATIGAGVLRSSNNGKTWLGSSLKATGYNPTSLIVADSSSATQVLYAGAVDAGASMSTNGGSQWVSINAGLTDREVTCIAVSKSNLYVGSVLGALAYSSNQGASWALVTPERSKSTVYSIVASGVHSSAPILYAGTSQYHTFRSDDLGATWVAITHGLPATSITCLLSLDSTDPNTAILVGTGMGVYASTDAGINWTFTDVGLSNVYVNELLRVGTTLYMCSTYGGVFASNTVGKSWTQMGTGLTNPFATALAFYGTRMFAGTRNFDTIKTAKIFMSTDSAATWHEVLKIPTAANVTCFAQLGSSIYAGTTNAGLYRSDDNGNTWDTVNNGLPGLTYSKLVAADGKLIAATAGGILTSTDRGLTWKTEGIGLTPAQVSSITLVGSKLYASTLGDGVWYRPIAEVGVGQSPSANSFTLAQNYPNPFNPSTTINYSLSERGLVTIDVFDVLGRKIETLINEMTSAGSHNLRFDATNLPSGIYTAQISANGSRREIKMVLKK
jgi:photosystem II stability/assembly factor-like uncharacterized protein